MKTLRSHLRCQKFMLNLIILMFKANSFSVATAAGETHQILCLVRFLCAHIVLAVAVLAFSFMANIECVFILLEICLWVWLVISTQIESSLDNTLFICVLGPKAKEMPYKKLYFSIFPYTMESQYFTFHKQIINWFYRERIIASTFSNIEILFGLICWYYLIWDSYD